MEIEKPSESLLTSQLVQNSKPAMPGSIASLASSLTQALVNKDIDIVKFIFSNSDPAIVKDTLSNFNDVELYGRFLDTCNSMIDSFPNETEHTLNWLYSFLEAKRQELKAGRLLVDSPLRRNNYLKVKTKTITPLLDVKHKLEFVLGSNEARVLSDARDGFGQALVSIDERMESEPQALIGNHVMKPKENGKANGSPLEDYNDMEEEEELDNEEDIDEQFDEAEEELMYDEDDEERKEPYDDEEEVMDEEDAELERELEKYEQREKQFKANKKEVK